MSASMDKPAPTPGARRPWMTGERAAFRQMRADGKTLREIAETLGRTVTAVEQKAIEWGMRARVCKPWTKADFVLVVRMVRADAPTAEIAAALGRTPGAVKHKVTAARKALAARGLTQ